MIFGMKRDLLLNSLLDLLLEKMKTLRGSISKSAKAEAPPKNPPWPRGFGVGTGVPGSIALGIGGKGEKEN